MAMEGADSGVGYTRASVFAATHCHLFPGRGRHCSLTWALPREDRTRVDTAWEVVTRWLEPANDGTITSAIGRTYSDARLARRRIVCRRFQQRNPVYARPPHCCRALCAARPH